MMKHAHSWLATGGLAVAAVSACALVILNAASEDEHGSSVVKLAESAAEAARALRLAYGEHAAEALDRAPRIEPRGAAFELRRSEAVEPGEAAREDPQQLP